MNIKMSSILTGLVMMLALSGTGCASKQDKLVEDQQIQINQLLGALAEKTSSTQALEEKITTLETKLNAQPASVSRSAALKSSPIQPKTVQASQSSEDPLIKIERCKADAKQMADRITTDAYANYDYQRAISQVCDTPELENATRESKMNCISAALDGISSQREQYEANTYNKIYSACLSK